MNAPLQAETGPADEILRLRARIAELEEELSQLRGESAVSRADEHKQVLEGLRISQERLELAHEAAGIGSWDWMLQTNEIHCSVQYGPLYGLPPGESAPSFTEWMNLVHPEDRSRIEGEVRRTLATSNECTEEFRVIWPDGSIHWLSCRVRVFRDAQGNATRMFGVNMDITGRKQAEQALRNSEKHFREMADGAPVMICASSANRLATFFNKGWLSFTGRTIEQELGSGWLERVHPDDREHTVASLTASSDARSYCQIEYRLQRGDGEYRWLLCNGVPRFEPDGSFAGYVGSATDITDLKRLHEESVRQQKLESLGVLAGGIAHDFNNLLGSVLADAELLRADLAADSAAYEGVERIRLVASRASEIVGELMAYAGQGDAVIETVDLSALVGEMLRLIKVLISKRAALKLDLPRNLPIIRANAARIKQVVLNLILNASEALGDNEGVVSVAVAHVQSALPASAAAESSSGDYIRLDVGDTGCGIPKEDLDRIFDPFFTTKTAGRGLGLSTVQGIIRSHGGSIRVVSAPGQGSRFEVRLPSTDLPAEITPDKAVVMSEDWHGAGPTVLMVEDEDSLRIPVAKILRRRGLIVHEVSDGPTAIAFFGACQADVDIVLLDVTLPSMSGAEVMEELRRVRSDIEIILTSAYGEEAVMGALRGEPPRAYIRKPYSPKELADLLWSASRRMRK